MRSGHFAIRMQSVKTLFLLLIISIITSFVICSSWKSLPYEEQLIQIQLEHEFGCFAEALGNQPIDIRALLLDYSDNEELVLKTRIALTKYPEKAGEILLLYGLQPEFKEILLNYGEAVIPVIDYFLKNEIQSLKLMNTTAKGIQFVADAAQGIWNRPAAKEETNAAGQSEPVELGPKERGWYAVNFIKEEGYDFLGQFVVDTHKQVKWIQTERVLENISSFFANGIRRLETQYVLEDEITKGDLFWAGVDVVAAAGTLKLLRAGRAAARTGKQLTITTRTRLFASKLLSRGEITPKIVKYGAVAATAYIVAVHPSLLNSMFAEAAKLLGLNPWLVRFAGWSLIILLAISPFLGVFKLMARFIIRILNLIISGILWLENPLKRSRPELR